MLSPDLACSAISPRQCLHAAMQANHGRRTHGRKGPVSWIRQLIWREFYRHVMVGCPRVCRFKAFRRDTDELPWTHDDAEFARWCEGRTGVPILDAAMRQLTTIGWMHNRLRMIVAMYLAKDLFVDWRRGERFFMNHLVDGDLAQNNGGRQWAASAGADAAPYFRILSPSSQSERFDPDGAFIHRYVPELADIPARDLHDPSRIAPLVRRNRNYPEPMVDHKVARERAIAWVKELRSGNRSTP